MIPGLYRRAAAAAAPLLAAWLRARQRRGKEDATRLNERLGLAGHARPAGSIVWMHAASVGEAMSVLALVSELRTRWPAVTILFTSGTITSARLLAERLPSGCLHQYMPLDVPRWLERFLDHWQPAAVIWVESELWPNTIAAIRARRLPLALVNARMSPRSFERWRLVASFVRPPLDAFEPCLAQDQTIARRLSVLGARHVRCLGNLKYDAAPLPADDAELAHLRAIIGDRPAWLAASIQPEEAAAIAAAHQQLAVTHADLLTVIVPRHPARGADVAETCRAAGLSVSQRSAAAAPARETAVYVADTLGELGLFYRLARAAFIGGSLVPHGGQNALEAARLDCPIVVGPHMFNFPELLAALLEARAAEQIAQASDLGPAIGRLLDDPALAQARAAAARAIAESERGAVGRVADALTPLFKPLRSAAEAAHARA